MILFYGYPDDRPLEMAVETAVALGAEHAVVDQRQAAEHDLVLEMAGGAVGGALTVAGATIPLGDVTSVYARPLTTPVPAGPRDKERAQAFDQGFLDWTDVADCLVVSRPSAMQSNASKPYQAQEIAASGLEVPETLVTSDPDEVRAFWQRHGDVVFKSTSGIRSIVRRLDVASSAGLARVRDLPTQFQKLVEGVDVRAHVVGDRVFAAEIRSGAVDYRYARSDGLDAELAAIDLPDDVVARCVEVAARLALPFAGVDLRRRPDGTYVCFEVNPMPGYSYFESETNLPISTALVELLARKAG